LIASSIGLAKLAEECRLASGGFESGKRKADSYHGPRRGKQRRDSRSTGQPSIMSSGGSVAIPKHERGRNKRNSPIGHKKTANLERRPVKKCVDHEKEIRQLKGRCSQSGSQGRDPRAVAVDRNRLEKKKEIRKQVYSAGGPRAEPAARRRKT